MSGFGALLKGKCPHCREGNVFKYTGLNLKKFKQINENCPNCGVKFESEPGFFWGAMYFSYAYSVALFIIVGAFFFTLSDDVHLGWYIGTVFTLMVITSTISFRMSRLLMMYIAAPYRHFRGKT